jgi:hypothetical protein
LSDSALTFSEGALPAVEAYNTLVCSFVLTAAHGDKGQAWRASSEASAASTAARIPAASAALVLLLRHVQHSAQHVDLLDTALTFSDGASPQKLATHFLGIVH